MPRGTGVYDTSRLQNRLWTPHELNPTVWISAERSNQLPGTLRNIGTLGDAAVTGTTLIWAPNGILNNSTRGKGAFNLNSAAATTLGTITGLAVSTLSDLRTAASPAVTATWGATVVTNSIGGSYPVTGVLVVTWPNATITVGSTRFSWLNGTLNAATGGGTSGASGGAGTFAYAGGMASAGGSSLGRWFVTSGGNTLLFNTATANRPGVCTYNEIIMVDRQLTTQERQTLEGYLAWKWGYQRLLVSGHPYAGKPPEIGA